MADWEANKIEAEGPNKLGDMGAEVDVIWKEAGVVVDSGEAL